LKKFDELDKDIIWVLSQNNGLSTWKIASMLNEQEPKVRYRVMEMVKLGFVKKTKNGFVLNPKRVIVSEDVLILMTEKGFWAWTSERVDTERLVSLLKKELAKENAS